ncbi:hypothetical protein ACFVX6_32710 [Streptomyces sp. NPDC058289]|uniref:hypothetical protein n=1 Tax=Streptomyces sp. NPDC058289 TaxID=3346425 RepID=UPI0036EF4696
MDVESVTAELLALRPAEFTAARNEYVARARKAGDKELAAAVAGLRKPTVAVWTAGLLARRRPDEAQGLMQLGKALRTAHRTLDAGQLRKLSHDQHVVIGELARTARALAAEAGQAVSEPVLHEVEGILHAVLADADVAAHWAAGRLTAAPDVALGFAGLEPQAGAVPPSTKSAAEPGATVTEQARRRTPKTDEDEAAARARQERVKAAAAELAEARAEADRLEAESAAGQELADSAAAAVKAAEEELAAAKERLSRARTASADATAHYREAARAASKARAQAETAARKVNRLTGAED